MISSHEISRKVESDVNYTTQAHTTHTHTQLSASLYQIEQCEGLGCMSNVGMSADGEPLKCVNHFSIYQTKCGSGVCYESTLDMCMLGDRGVSTGLQSDKSYHARSRSEITEFLLRDVQCLRPKCVDLGDVVVRDDCVDHQFQVVCLMGLPPPWAVRQRERMRRTQNQERLH